ncbi:MAG: ABC transporter permease [Desulfobacteraceae bacterium]|nr:ABC transporter permease [Desulfobacteraceae bacterium]
MKEYRGKRNAGDVIYRTILVLIYTFILLPEIIVVIAAFNAGEYLTFPPQGFSIRWFIAFAHSEPFVNSMFMSLRLAISTLLITLTLGTMSAFFVVRYGGRLRGLIRVLMTAPLLFPAVITGAALLIYYYQVTGWRNRTFVGLLIGHVLITSPYVFLTISSTLYNFDTSLEEAARSLGASKLKTFFKITMPLIKSGLIAGGMFAFIISWGQFPISLLLAGIGLTILPIQLFDYVRWSFDPTAAAAAAISILLALISVIVVHRLADLGSLPW